MKPRKIRWSFLAWFLLISVMVSQAQAQKIRVAMPGLSVGSLTFFVAQEKGYYEQESFEALKVTGAGGGGHLFVLADPSKHNSIEKELKN